MTPDDVLTIADALKCPTDERLPTDQAWWRQSLAHGVPGIALLHIELAAAGARPWDRAHAWLSFAVAAPVTAGTNSGGFYGAPAIAYALAAAATARPGAYRRALASVEAGIAADIQRRTGEGHARIDAGHPPLLAEFDTLRGLAGLGACLLLREPDGAPLGGILRYLVRLAEPLNSADGQLPGWWTTTAPTGRIDEQDFPGGHANLGLAHGIGGPLALLSLAALRDITVPGQTDAIASLCRWLDTWQIDTATGTRWPYMITRDELANGPTAEVTHSGAKRRPSWCYGTAGTARVQQLAAAAIADTARRRMAEAALIDALTEPAQLAATTDASLCHGHSGLARIAFRAAETASGQQAHKLHQLSADLLAKAQPSHDSGPGLLEGTTGSALAGLELLTGARSATNWDTCLLIA